MLISLLTYLLISNALNLRKDKSILFSRIVMVSLILTSFLAFNNLFVLTLDKGIGIFGGLFHVTAFTQNFNIFILLISATLIALSLLIILIISTFGIEVMDNLWYDLVSSEINSIINKFTIIFNKVSDLIYDYYETCNIKKLLLVSTVIKLGYIAIYPYIYVLGITSGILTYIGVVLLFSIILYSWYKKRIFKLMLNLFILLIYWKIIFNCISDISFYESFLYGYIYLSIEDIFFDLEEIINSFGLDETDLAGGGPNMEPENDKSPKYLLSIWDNTCKLHNNPNVQDFKEKLTFSGSDKNVNDVREEIKSINDTPGLKKGEFNYIKEYIKTDGNLWISSYGIFMVHGYTGWEYMEDLHRRLYSSVIEYNTLKKAIQFYNNPTANLDKTYENCFTIWQKRQLGMWFSYGSAKLLFPENATSTNRLTDFKKFPYIRDFTLDSVAYQEIVENYLYISLNVIKQFELINHLQNRSPLEIFNLYSDSYRLGFFIHDFSMEHINRYKLAYSWLYNYNYNIVDSERATHIFNMYSRLSTRDGACIPPKVGIGLAKMFSHTKFTVSCFKFWSDNNLIYSNYSSRSTSILGLCYAKHFAYNINNNSILTYLKPSPPVSNFYPDSDLD